MGRFNPGGTETATFKTLNRDTVTGTVQTDHQRPRGCEKLLPFRRRRRSSTTLPQIRHILQASTLQANDQLGGRLEGRQPTKKG